MIKNILYTSSILLLFINCKQTQQSDTKEQSNLFEFAKHINISQNENQIIIESNGNSTTFNQSELPLTNIMVETSAAIAYLSELDALSTIKGVSDPSYIFNEKIRAKIANKSILEIGNLNELYVETILKHKPQLLIASTNPALAKQHQQLAENGIKILYLDEYKEIDPLGRLEYLKIFGRLLNKESLAEKRFKTVVNNYDSIKKLIKTQGKGNVKTILNTMYGDVWYLPTANTLQAKLIDDAKGNYIFNNQNGNNTLSLTFEEVYTQAKNANYWLNTSYTSKAQLKAAYPNYTWFDAYKTGNIFNPDKRSTPNYALDYYEQGIVRPDIILNDLGKIFYPNLFPEYQLYFYQKIQ